jgi:hypothetical protein
MNWRVFRVKSSLHERFAAIKIAVNANVIVPLIQLTVLAFLTTKILCVVAPRTATVDVTSAFLDQHFASVNGSCDQEDVMFNVIFMQYW